MAVTPSSLTGDSSLDKLVLSFYIIRMMLLVAIIVICLPQFIFDIRYFHQRKQRPNARCCVLFCLAGFALTRLLYCSFILDSHQYDTNDMRAFYSSMWATFFQFCIFIFIGCFWMTLLYTFFISDKIKFENQSRCWNAKNLDTYYNVAFVVIIGFGGTTIFINGLTLLIQMRRHENQVITQNTNVAIANIVNDIKLLSFVIAFSMTMLIVRSVIFYVLKVPQDSNYRHLYSFITFLAEMLSSLTVMYAVADKCINYLMFKPVVITRRLANDNYRKSIPLAQMQALNKNKPLPPADPKDSTEKDSFQFNDSKQISNELNSIETDDGHNESVVEVVPNTAVSPDVHTLEVVASTSPYTLPFASELSLDSMDNPEQTWLGSYKQ
ncbi:hypothetical protein SAMD00019534_064580 [Acytostelium subglobosum LB1]|uniref:hypothetical protein n=1 Tax=Acytostelium subglobosum LB1 TaxID=1410327 RepID=UPI00064487EC|nr:hypothetical protein SAMD00019534_064580 [Acytostelium subglobosum LB1]GAM23283.1 hypothetical protein SAMD00019534_064580 [Acytostelium subglobosum LB1]|eukprot:XP_012753732.1 hypothetical protein SAMD00019534_064580 [Acytostelium subglobosum LB1]